MYEVRIFLESGEVDVMRFSDLKVADMAYNDTQTFFDWILVDTDVIVSKDIVNNATGAIVRSWCRA